MSFHREYINPILSDIKAAKLSGNQKAYEEYVTELFYRVRKPLLKHAYNVLLVKGDAEECFVVTIEKVAERILSFNENEDGFNWIVTTARNTAIDMNAVYRNLTPIENVAYYLSHDKKTEDTIALSMDLKNALSRLSEKDRNIFLYYYYDQFSISQIAKYFGHSKSTIHAHLEKSRETLRKYLEIPERNGKK